MSQVQTIPPVQMTSQNSDFKKFWLDDEWFIPVDDNGECKEVYEGALGYVVRVRHKDSSGSGVLKMPRLLGETLRENAYINDLMEQEIAAAFKVNLESVKCLLHSTTKSVRGHLRRRINAQIGEATKFHNGVILVQFSQMHKPRLCWVCEGENGEVEHWPPDVKVLSEVSEIEALISKTYNRGLDEVWSEAVVIHDNKEDNEPAEKIASLGNALSQDSAGNFWYASLPSISYKWADGSLQSAIGSNSRGSWTKDQHLRLIKRITTGVAELHRNKMLHADLRPANILFVNDDPTDPENYFVADYGSFAETSGNPMEKSSPAAQSMRGPVVDAERASVFYAPERSVGREHETADTAIVVQQSDSQLLVLGWREKLIDRESGELIFSKQDLTQKWKDDSQPSERGLTAGDRLQLRDYIFVLKSEEKQCKDPSVRMFECESFTYRISHGKVAIRDDNSECEEVRHFSVPRVIELMKWSVATDLYSIGVMLLYSIYRSSSSEDEQKHDSEIEIEFREMLEYFGKDTFRKLWPLLESTRIELEIHLLDPNLNAEDLKNTPFPIDQYGFDRISRDLGSSTASPGEITLLQQIIDLTNWIVLNVPKARRLVEALDYQLGEFILYLHFALCCIRREEDLLAYNEPAPWEAFAESKRDLIQRPFCQNRLTDFSPDPMQEASLKALSRIRLLEQCFGSTIEGRETKLDALKVESDDISLYNPRSDAALAAQFKEAQKDLAAQKQAIQEFIHSLDVEIENTGRFSPSKWTLEKLAARLKEEFPQGYEEFEESVEETDTYDFSSNGEEADNVLETESILEETEEES